MGLIWRIKLGWAPRPLVAGAGGCARGDPGRETPEPVGIPWPLRCTGLYLLEDEEPDDEFTGHRDWDSDSVRRFGAKPCGEEPES
jgi:hypothetical protein